MKRIFGLLIPVLLSVSASAQEMMEDTTETKRFINRNPHPLKHWYVATGGEIIFSFADVKEDSVIYDNRLRVSLFPHIQQQYHYNFGKGIGFYTGFSLINTGFRNDVTLADSTQFELRQRAFSFGIPLALKLGSMTHGNYIALGATAEFMLHYRYKLYYGSERDKQGEWFSDHVNTFNPSLFVDFRNRTGGYIRFKYYLSNFLFEYHNFLLPGTQQNVILSPHQSTMFYISVGSTFMKKKPRKLTLEDV